MSDWKKKHANDSERAIDHYIVKPILEEFEDNLRHNPDVAAKAFDSALFRYGFRKCLSYVAQIARAEALGIDPETLRGRPEEITERQMELARMAVEMGKPVWVIEESPAADEDGEGAQ